MTKTKNVLSKLMCCSCVFIFVKYPQGCYMRNRCCNKHRYYKLYLYSPSILSQTGIFKVLWAIIALGLIVTVQCFRVFTRLLLKVEPCKLCQGEKAALKLLPLILSCVGVCICVWGEAGIDVEWQVSSL